MYTIPKGVTAISFDIWKTLLNAVPAYTWPRLELVFGHVGILGYGQEAITASYKRAEKYWNEQAEITGFDTGMAERIAFVLEDLGITDKKVPDASTIIELQTQSGLLRMRPEYRPTLTEPDLIETLMTLKAHGHLIGTLSNTGMGDCHMVAPLFRFYHLDRLLDVQLFSCEDGRAKPNPGLFLEMAARFGVQPHQVLHVGDNINADYRATKAGLHAVLFSPKGPKDGYECITSMKELIGA